MSEISLAREISSTPESPEIRLNIGYSSVASELHPEHNEDKIFISKNQKSFGVFDGMGGEVDGERAANICSEKIGQMLESAPESCSRQIAEDSIKEAFELTNIDLSHENFVKKRTSGSTATYGFIYKNETGGYEVAIGNAGDSRAYLLRGGVLTKITQDHGAINYLSSSDQTDHMVDDTTDASQLSPEQIALYKRRNEIYNHVGYPDGFVDVFFKNVLPGDTILFTSDGIHDNLTASEIQSILVRYQNETPELISQKLTAASISRSKEITPDGKKHFRSKKDDMTAMVIKIGQKNTLIETSETKESKIDLPKNFVPKMGLKINNQGSSGFITSDWEIYGINKKNGTFLVKKMVGRDLGEYTKFSHREISYGLAERLNRQPKPEDISKAEDFHQLRFTLKNIPEIQGSRETFTGESLVKLIEDVKKGIRPITAITHAFGLRDTVVRCLKQ